MVMIFVVSAYCEGQGGSMMEGKRDIYISESICVEFEGEGESGMFTMLQFFLFT